MHCSNCGKPVTEDENFCANCGFALKPSVPARRNASLFLRVIAYLIDVFILIIPLTIIILAHLYNKYGNAMYDPAQFTIILQEEMVWFSFISALMFLIYFTILEGRFQTTIGKRLLGAKIVRKDMTPIGFRESIERNVLRIIWDLPLIGLVLLILDVVLIFVLHRRLGDLAAGTYVVRN